MATNLKTLTKRDVLEKGRLEAEHLVRQWSDQLETYGEAFDLVSGSIVRELMPDGATISDEIPQNNYGRKFRERMAEKVMYGWAIYHRRLVWEKWARYVEQDVTRKAQAELLRLGIEDHPSDTYTMIVGLLRRMPGPKA